MLLSMSMMKNLKNTIVKTGVRLLKSLSILIQSPFHRAGKGKKKMPKEKKQTDLERFRDYLLYAAVTKELNSTDIMRCYDEFNQKMADEKIAKINQKVGRV